MCNYCGHVLVNRNVQCTCEWKCPGHYVLDMSRTCPGHVPDIVVHQSCLCVWSNSSLPYDISTHTTNNCHTEWLTQEEQYGRAMKIKFVFTTSFKPDFIVKYKARVIVCILTSVWS
jgi:hypothetical protein